jgi:thiol-disulfide isomerase/thioredoxin
MRWATLWALLVLALPGLSAQATPRDGAQATVLVYHPVDANEVDPFGVHYQGADPFSFRYQALAAQAGQFDYPVFLADGVRAIQSLPNPSVPFQGTLDAYDAAVRERAGQPVAVAITLAAEAAGPTARLQVRLEPEAPLQPSQGQHLHLVVALAEDPVHYQPPAPVSNGVVDHRFTVRAFQDAGEVDLASGQAVDRTVAMSLDPSWRVDRLLAAAWVQADEAPGRFQPHEVLQATHSTLDGTAVRQSGKGVLVEAYSATWCTPCLYGDLAIEQVAIRFGDARPLAAAGGPLYFEAAPMPLLALGGAIVVGSVLALAPGRRRP